MYKNRRLDFSCRLVENAILLKKLNSNIFLIIVLFLLTVNDCLYFYYTCSYSRDGIEIKYPKFAVKKLVEKIKNCEKKVPPCRKGLSIH